MNTRISSATPIRPSVVRQALLARGWQQPQLAAAAGITVQTVSNALHGKPLMPQTIAAIARALSATAIVEGTAALTKEDAA
jgi:transcriptional regulator with XRE-family HTH domain